MRDYTGYDRPNMMDFSAKKLFEIQLKSEGECVEIDGVKACGIINNSFNPYNEKKEERKLTLWKDVVIKKGSYVKYDNKIYLVTTDIDCNKYYKDCKMEQCTRMLRLPSGKLYPCTLSNDSYGSKQNVSSDILSEVDSKAKIEVQANKDILEECDLDTRYMFANSKFDIYKCIDINLSIKDGIMTMIAKKDKFIPGLDRIEDNYCYQGNTENKPNPTNYTITGKDNLKINCNTIYDITPKSGNIDIRLDEETSRLGIARIIKKDTYSIEVQGLKLDELFIVEVWLDGKKQTQKAINITKY